MNKNRKNYLVYSLLAVALMIVLLIPLSACEELGYPAATTTTPTVQPKEEKAPTTVIDNKDEALMAVYRNLIEKAESSEAKLYLADFYAASVNWTAVSEIFKDHKD